jgi:hypothetical protein
MSFTTLSGTPGCNAPANLNISNITSSGGTIGWTLVPGAQAYEYVVDQLPTPPTGSGAMVTGTSTNITSLAAGTVYYAHVRTVCNATAFSSWSNQSFTTAVGGGCSAPGGITVSNVTDIGASISWAPVSGGTSYEYAVTLTNTPPSGAGNNLSLPTTTLTGLTPGTSYYVHVRTACGLVYSPWTSQTFTTTITALSSFGATEGLSVYPNPVKDVLTVSAGEQNSRSALITVSNLAGQVLIKKASSGKETYIDLSGIDRGIYILTFVSDETKIIYKIIKE